MSKQDQLIKIETIKPHSPKQELIMRAFLFGHVREVFVACGTKFGKSISASTGLFNGIVNKKGSTFRWIAPIYRQSQIGMDYFKNIIPPPPHSEVIPSKMLIRFPNLGSRIEFWHTQKPIDLEGAAVAAQVGDEAAKMPFDAYVSANTTTTMTRGPSMWISTPWGKNWFYKKYMEAKEHMEWSIRNGKEPVKIAIHAPTAANPYIQQEIIDQAQKNLPDRLFRQLYLAEFLDDGSTFINFRACIYGPELDVTGAVQYWFDDKCYEAEVVIGVDWAKHQDFTVFIAIDPHAKPRRVIAFMRFQGLGYTQAIKELWSFSKKFQKIGLILHDKTGVGEAIDDMLAPLPLPFQGVTFTNAIKSNMVNNLGMSFEKTEISMPNWPEMLKELDSFEVIINSLGNPIYNAPQGMHDDIVMSLCLAHKAASEYAGDFEIKYLEDLPKEDLSLDKFYNDLMEDEDDFALFGR